MKLIVIDMPNALVDDELDTYEGFTENVATIIAAARENHIEVIHVQHDGGPGSGFSPGDEAFEIAVHGAAGGQASDDRRSADECLHRRERIVRVRAGVSRDRSRGDEFHV